MSDFDKGVPLTEKEIKEIEKMFKGIDNLHIIESKDKKKKK